METKNELKDPNSQSGLTVQSAALSREEQVERMTERLETLLVDYDDLENHWGSVFADNKSIQDWYYQAEGVRDLLRDACDLEEDDGLEAQRILVEAASELQALESTTRHTFTDWLKGYINVLLDGYSQFNNAMLGEFLSYDFAYFAPGGDGEKWELSEYLGICVVDRMRVAANRCRR